MNDLDASLKELRRGFAAAGFPIEAPVRVMTHPDLPAAATTYREADAYVIVVGEGRADGPHTAFLLAHELGHVQRMASGHASHDDDAITAAYASIEGKLRFEYQRRVLHHVINHTQDLYADPISFRVVGQLGLSDQGQVRELIASFVNDEPYEIEDARERRWDQAEDMVGNARAIALAQLMGADDARAMAEAAQARYLKRIAPDIARAAPWFQARLLDLPEDITRAGFASLLVEYVGRFVATAEG